jgi:hypothetical protein
MVQQELRNIYAQATFILTSNKNIYSLFGLVVENELL